MMKKKKCMHVDGNICLRLIAVFEDKPEPKQTFKANIVDAIHVFKSSIG
jgi:hypothetical protein